MSTIRSHPLLLPVMWPYTSFGDFSSGEVSVASIKLEVIEANATAPWCSAQRPAQIQGIAFRPAAPVDDAYVAELDARSIPHSAPELYPRWTTSTSTTWSANWPGRSCATPTSRSRKTSTCAALRLVPGARDRVQHLTLTVRSATWRRKWRQVADTALRGSRCGSSSGEDLGARVRDGQSDSSRSRGSVRFSGRMPCLSA